MKCTYQELARFDVLRR